MRRDSNDIIANGVLVAQNNKPDCGHFYEIGGEIYRTWPNGGGCYPICSQAELVKLAAKGLVVLV